MSKRGSLTVPFIVRYLEDRVKDWTESGGAIYMEPLEPTFDNLVVRSHWISLTFDRKWEFTATLNLVSDDDMAHYHENYRRLKELECELGWSGFLRREPYFKTSSHLLKLKSMINQIEPNPELTESLNSDSNLMRLTKKIRPDQVTIALHSINELLLPSINSEEAYFNALVDYYKNPSRISWKIISFRFLQKGPFHRKNVVGMFETLSMISSHIKRVSMGFLNSKG